MKVNISYIQGDKKLKDNMWLTAQPNYKNIDVEWEDLYKVVSSDYRQYSPYYYRNNTKKGVNWDNTQQDLLIFDIDSDMSIDEARKKFGKYKHLITTTKNHQVDKNGVVCDRFRVILPATNIPAGDKYFDMLDVMVSQVTAIDKQPNCKSGAFLGNSKAINSYNDGEVYDCTEAVKVAEYKRLNEKKIKDKNFDRYIGSNNTRNNDWTFNIADIKKQINGDIVADIVRSLGYEVFNNKFSIRDERTPSTTIFRDGGINDFGSDFKGDVFDLLTQKHNMTMIEALRYVYNFLKE